MKPFFFFFLIGYETFEKMKTDLQAVLPQRVPRRFWEARAYM